MSTTDRLPLSPGRMGLSGAPWLVWRQHRAVLVAAVALLLAAVGWMAHQHGLLTDRVARTTVSGDVAQVLRPSSEQLHHTGSLLLLLPVLAAVFLGAPLFSGAHQDGTTAFATLQSAGRTRWAVTQAAMYTMAAGAGAGVLAGVFHWWWQPFQQSGAAGPAWSDPVFFDGAGPVLCGLTLLLTAVGCLVGILVRRTLPAMLVTLVASVAVESLWSTVRLLPAATVTVHTHAGVGGDAYPRFPAGGLFSDQSMLTEGGHLIGYGTCALPTDTATRACLRAHDVVGWSVTYLPGTDAPALQWVSAAVMALLAVGVAALAVRLVVRRPA